MASNLWCQDLIAAGVPDSMAKELAATYTNPRVFFFSFKSVDALDVCTKKVAHKVGLISETEGDVADSHPAIGAVRAFWDSLKSPQPLSHAAGSLLPSASPTAALLPVVASARLSLGEREALRSKFLEDFPGTTLSDKVLPSLQFLQTIHVQCQQKCYEWVPWKKIVSEEQSIQLREKRSADSHTDLVKLLAHASGIVEEGLDGDIHPSPFRLQLLLTVRANAFSMCSAGHLSLWNAYTDAFLDAYTRTPCEGFRPPSVQEAEEADRRAMQEMFRHAHKHGSIDSALRMVVKERDLLRSLLICMPKLPRSLAPADRKRKEYHDVAPRAMKRRKGECFDFLAGRCDRGDKCRYKHPAEAVASKRR